MGFRLSPGEAISRFRDDVEDVYGPINEWYRLVGEGVFAAIAVGVMLRIYATVTLVTLVPLAAAVSVAHWMTVHLRRYRAASRAATARVTAFIGGVVRRDASGQARRRGAACNRSCRRAGRDAPPGMLAAHAPATSTARFLPCSPSAKLPLMSWRASKRRD